MFALIISVYAMVTVPLIPDSATALLKESIKVCHAPWPFAVFKSVSSTWLLEEDDKVVVFLQGGGESWDNGSLACTYTGYQR